MLIENPVVSSPWRDYHRLTRTATYSFLAALPLLVFYETLILLANHGSVLQVRVGAEVWVKRLLATFGVTGMLALGAAVLLVGVAIFFYERKQHIPLRPRYFGWMIAESACYAVVLAYLVSGTVSLLFAMAPAWSGMQVAPPVPQAAPPGFWTKLALSIGAGLYEELVFRVVLVGSLYWLLRRLFAEQRYAYLVAAVIGALVFSAVHYLGALGDAFTLPSFTFRFLFGLALNFVFLLRGFGVAAWTHALYDVMVVLLGG